MNEFEKLHGLHNTGMSMHERFTLLAHMQVGRRGKRNPFAARTRSQTMNSDFIEALAHQIEYKTRRPTWGFAFRGRGRANSTLRKFGSTGSLHEMPGLRRARSNSFGNLSQSSKNQNWRRSNGNLSFSSMNGSVHSFRSEHSWGARRRGGRRGRGRGRSFRGRTHQGRVSRFTEVDSVPRPARGSGRSGMRRNTAATGNVRRGWGRGRGRGRGGRGMFRAPAKPVPTKEELDAQLDQYMSGTKAALDKELDEYMKHAMDFD